MTTLISPEYKEQIAELHRTDESWGVASIKEAPMVASIINKLNIQEVLDYGSGKGRLGKAMREHLDHKITLTNYDPAIVGIDLPPEPHEFVACIDVLEHIEPDYVHEVIHDLARVTKRCAYITVSCQEAKRILPDGRNAHICIQPPWWWMHCLSDWFTIGQFTGNRNGFMVLVKPKP